MFDMAGWDSHGPWVEVEGKRFAVGREHWDEGMFWVERCFPGTPGSFYAYGDTVEEAVAEWFRRTRVSQ